MRAVASSSVATFAVFFVLGYIGGLDQHSIVLVPAWFSGLMLGTVTSIVAATLVTLLWTPPETRERRIQEMLNRK